MHGSLAENKALLDALKPVLGNLKGAGVAVCAPYPYLAQLQAELSGTPIAWGAQNVSEQPKGAFTGEVSTSMLKDFGCKYVIVGHSERRSIYGESDELVAKKYMAAQAAGLIPILCVGETLEERQAGQTEKVIESQLQGALEGLVADELYELVIAYEPVWAIGTGQVCDAPEANRICGWIRQWLAHHFEPELGEHVRILYGGSVKASNAHELLHQPEIDGALVGGASLNAEEFEQITYCARTH